MNLRNLPSEAELKALGAQSGQPQPPKNTIFSVPSLATGKQMLPLLDPLTQENEAKDGFTVQITSTMHDAWHTVSLLEAPANSLLWVQSEFDQGYLTIYNGYVSCYEVRDKDPYIHRLVRTIDNPGKMAYSAEMCPCWWSNEPTVHYKHASFSYVIPKEVQVKAILNSKGRITIGYFISELGNRDRSIPKKIGNAAAFAPHELDTMKEWESKGKLNTLHELFGNNVYFHQAAIGVSSTIYIRHSNQQLNPYQSFTGLSKLEMMALEEFWTALFSNFQELRGIMGATKNPVYNKAMMDAIFLQLLGTE